ncbi:hypothetical protein GDO81_026736, partial [Engystomops pustulosus]
MESPSLPAPGGLGSFLYDRVQITTFHLPRIPSVSEEDARKALMDYANGKCCYRSTPAEEMDFHELRPFNTYRYRLETFTESRTCDWVTKPYRGQYVLYISATVRELHWGTAWIL